MKRTLVTYIILGLIAAFGFMIAFNSAQATPKVTVTIDNQSYNCSPVGTTPTPPPVPPTPPPTPPTPPQAGVTVFKPSPYNTTFIPGCIKGENFSTSGCIWRGSMANNHVYAMRMDIDRNKLKNQTVLLQMRPAEAGETNRFYDATISNHPGAMDSVAAGPCKTKNKSAASFNLKLPEHISGWGTAIYCPVDASKPVYLNIKPAGNCGVCRVKVSDYSNGAYWK